MTAPPLDATKTLEVLHSVVETTGYNHVMPESLRIDPMTGENFQSIVASYFHWTTGAPRCLVGAALAEVGLDPALVLREGTQLNTRAVDGLLEDEQVAEQVAFDDDARGLLFTAQTHQDGSREIDRRWGTALGHAYCEAFGLRTRRAGEW